MTGVLAMTERFDSMRGVHDGWTRQIAFVKDPAPLGNNCFVVSDTLREPAPMKWQLWLTAERVTSKPRAALGASGRIAARGHELHDTQATFKKWNLIRSPN